MITTRRVVLLSLAVCLDRIGIAGAGAGRREGVLRRQDRADDRRLRHRRRLRHLLADDRALSRQGAWARPSSSRTSPAPAGWSRSTGCTWRRPTACRSRSSNGTSAAFAQLTEQIGRALRPRQVQLPGDGRRAARALAGGAGFSHPGGPAGDRCQDEVALGLLGRNVRASASAPPSPARRSSSIATWCRATRAAPTPGLAVTRGEMDALYVPESSANNFVQGQAELGAGDDLAHQARASSRTGRPIFEAARMDRRPDLGDGFPRQCRKARPHPDRAARTFRRRGSPSCRRR